MTTLSIVIPAYNEERGIADIVHRVLAVKEPLAKVGVDDLELLVVDDGSKDKTAEIASSIPGVTLIQHVKNKGYGAALKYGFSQAKGELIGFLDADGTYPPEHFPDLCTAALNGGELIIGSRMAGASSKMPLVRRIGNWLFANLLTIIARQRVTDSASGMRVFKKEILAQIYPLPDGLNLTPVMSTRAIHEGIKIQEVPIPYSERQGRSKLNALRDGKIFLQSMLWTALSYNPVRILGLLGVLGVGLAAIIFLGLVILRLQGVTTLQAWQVAMLFIGLLSSVVGISLFSLGATFNYLVSLFYTKPIQQGLFGKPIFTPSLDQQFGWMGSLIFTVGLILAIVSMIVGINAGDISRLWLYLLASAMLIINGVQMVIYWVLMRVLEDLSQREIQAAQDMQAGNS